VFVHSKLQEMKEANETNNAAPQSQQKAEGKAAADQKVQKPLEKAKEKSLHVHFKAVFHGLTTGASLLPSLKAQHKVRVVDQTAVRLCEACGHF
jgi:hypothetical protein